jgi:hypothetical protein
MAENIIIFLFSLGLLYRELKFALHLAHKEIIDHNIASRLIKFILDSDQLEHSLHGFTVIKQIHSLQDVDEAALGALQFGSHQIADPEDHQVDVLPSDVSPDLLARLQQVMDQQVRIVQHQGCQHRVHL